MSKKTTTEKAVTGGLAVLAALPFAAICLRAEGFPPLADWLANIALCGIIGVLLLATTVLVRRAVLPKALEPEPAAPRPNKYPAI